jgi:predicted CoA-binding protein
MDEDSNGRLIESDDDVGALLDRVRTIAVLGIKDGSDPDAPANFVPAYAQSQGFKIYPVPVYYPGLTRILGEPVYRQVRDIPVHIDLVNVFRRPTDIPAHLDDLILARPTAVWFQLGIRNDEAAHRLAAAGILVVQDRCLQVDLRLWGW